MHASDANSNCNCNSNCNSNRNRNCSGNRERSAQRFFIRGRCARLSPLLQRG